MAGVKGQRSGGLNRKSDAVKALEGTLARPRGGAPVRPHVAGGLASPDAPSGLSAGSVALWRRLHEEFDLTSAATLELLESALRSRDVAEQARALLVAEGLTFRDKSGQPKAHPAAAIQRDARAAFVTCMRVLGFPAEDQ